MPLPPMPPPMNDPFGMAGLVNGVPPAFQGLFADALAQHQQARGQADQLWQQLQQGIGAPPPEVDPQRAFMARLAGGISQALAPQMNGQALAESAISGRNAELATRKQQALSALHDRYQEAAKQAEEAGDTEKAIKMRAAELKINKELAAETRAHTLADTKDQRAFELKKQDRMLQMQGANSLAVASVGLDKAERVARLQLAGQLAGKGLKPGPDGGDPVPLTSAISAEALSTQVRTMITAERDKGTPKEAIITGIRSYWAQRTDAEPLDNSGVAAYISRLRTPPIQNKGWFGDRKEMYTPDEVAHAAVVNFMPNMTSGNLPDLYRQGVVAGMNRYQWKDAVKRIADELSLTNGAGQPLTDADWELVFGKDRQVTPVRRTQAR